MTHCARGTLRGYLDGELDAAEREAVRAHLAGCAACRTELAGLGEESAWAGARLRAYARGADGGEVAGAAAWERMSAVWGAALPGAADRPAPEAALGRARPRRVWPVVSAAAAGLALCSLTLSPVRAAAGDLLQVFRAQQVQFVTLSPADVAQITQALQQAGSSVDIRGLASVSVTPNTPPASVTLAQARQMVTFPLTVPAAPPAGYALASVKVEPQTQIQFSHLQVGAINRLLTSLGSRELLPAAVGGATIDLEIPSAALLRYEPAGGGTAIELGETPTPVLTVPAGVDVNRVRQVLLSLPFLPQSLKNQLQAVANWQSTAVIPQVSGVSQPVNVGGAQGVYISPPQSGGAAMLLWLSGGVVHVVQGDLTLAQANAIALSMS